MYKIAKIQYATVCEIPQIIKSVKKLYISMNYRDNAWWCV